MSEKRTKFHRFLEKRRSFFDGKTFCVTGANSGIGFALTLHLVTLGAHVIMACRSQSRAEEAIIQIKKSVPSAVLSLVLYDQASLASIENFCRAIEPSMKTIDGFVLNAGIYYPKAEKKTVDGYDLTIGTNFFGSYFLMEGLTKLAKQQHCQPTFVLMSSLTAFLSSPGRFQQMETISRNKRYAASKRFITTLGYSYHERTPFPVHIVHPGVCETNILTGKDSGLTSWFARIGRKFLHLCTHSAKKASFVAIEALMLPKQSKMVYITPRGPFAISGYPKQKPFPKTFQKVHFLTDVEAYLRTKEKKHVRNS